ncbi:MAG: hypothetical protein AAF927_00590 [Bacteroidota bacterium]
MKTLFTLSLFFVFLAENVQSQVFLLQYPNAEAQIEQKSVIELDLSLLAQYPKLQLELWHKEELIDFVVLPAGTLTYGWMMEKQRASKHYQIRVVSAIDASLLAQSERFEIASTPLALTAKVAVIGSTLGLVGAGVLTLFRGQQLSRPEGTPIR